jgi:hypothetical protein
VRETCCILLSNPGFDGQIFVVRIVNTYCHRSPKINHMCTVQTMYLLHVEWSPSSRPATDAARSCNTHLLHVLVLNSSCSHRRVILHIHVTRKPRRPPRRRRQCCRPTFERHPLFVLNSCASQIFVQAGIHCEL